jgi:hypothetical protein
VGLGFAMSGDGFVVVVGGHGGGAVEDLGDGGLEILLGHADVVGGDAGAAVGHKAVEATWAGEDIVEFGVDEFFDRFAEGLGLANKHGTISCARGALGWPVIAVESAPLFGQQDNKK